MLGRMETPLQLKSNFKVQYIDESIRLAHFTQAKQFELVHFLLLSPSSSTGKQPGRNYFRYYRMLVAIWILFGLAWIALLFNLLTMVLEDTEKIIVKDLHQIGKVSKDNEVSERRRCWPAQFIPEEDLLPPCAGDNAEKTDSLAADSEQKKNEKRVFSYSKTIAITYENWILHWRVVSELF